MIQNHMIKIAAAVPQLKVGNPKYNAEKILEIIQDNTDAGLIVFPELSVTGYTCADLFQQEALLAGAKEAVDQIREETENLPDTLIVIGAPIRFCDSLYNCAVMLNGGRIAGIVPKSYIPNYSEFYEERWFASGRDIHTVLPDWDSAPFGTDLLFRDNTSLACAAAEICEDLWVIDKPSNAACAAGANLIVNLSASDELIGKKEYRRNMVLMQSACTYSGYIYVSAGTDESSTDLVFSGHTILAENGRLLKEGIFAERPAVYTGIVDLDTCLYNRMHQNTYVSEPSPYRTIPVHIKPLTGRYTVRADELSDALNKENYKISRYPFVPQDTAERAERCRSILQIQANGLATRVRNTGIKNLVIGISGGLDSTLALLVAYEAKKIVKDIHIIAYTMPNHGNTTGHTYNNAVKLMHILADECREAPIEEGVQLHLKQIGHSSTYEGTGDTAYENAQARYRTYILMDAANMENGLVVGTGDLSELALGWCTYNGDHMSMYGVNASVPKTLVQYICRTYAETCDNRELSGVLISICDTPITPELTPSKNGEIAQKTEEKIGKYDLNDFFLFHVLRYGIDPEKLFAFACAAFPDTDRETVRTSLIRFYQRFFHQQFKRSCLPDGPKVGSVTLSPRGDWRMPSDACVDLWIERIRNA